ncbi:MAG: hypothetical protein FWE41_01550 [Coriobacteriia bacterium]|nr:hypothetical protein [Coriobacteriia bacterium]
MAEKKTYVKPSGNPTTFRLLAVVLWVLGIALEVAAILIILGVIAVGNPIVWIIVALVLDLILVVAGAFLWKRANKIDPPSEKNKVEFFIKTQLGAIIAVIAFAPILFFLLTDKNLDKKAKTLVSIVAAVCLLAAVGLSIDYNPVSSEQLEQMRVNAQTSDFGDGEVKWSKNSRVYHTWADCSALKRIGEDNLREGDVEAAFAEGKVRMCKFCAAHFDITDGVEGGDVESDDADDEDDDEEEDDEEDE